MRRMTNRGIFVLSEGRQRKESLVVMRRFLGRWRFRMFEWVGSWVGLGWCWVLASDLFVG